jgi:putative spermidine/putrescine transport system ATP-binding protein
MQLELTTLHKKLGSTFIYVTHDQGEALSMSDRVAVFNRGRIEQVDHPRNLYTRPKTSFVADFVGTSNIISSDLAQQITGNSQAFSIRPEHISIYANQNNIMKATGEVVDIQYHGATSKVEMTVGNQMLSRTLNMVLSNTELSEAELPKIGQKLTLCWPQSRMVMLEN